MLTNLTTVKFSKCKGDKSDMEFLEYILGNAQVLKAVTIFALENLLVEEDPWFRAQVLKFPRASPHCEIRFLSWKLPPRSPNPLMWRCRRIKGDDYMEDDSNGPEPNNLIPDTYGD
uniref:Putative FBD domain-containing protein n=1 Tax=Helianthus annuus TaxID=4232 RepID=A0A251RT92_HELAN